MKICKSLLRKCFLETSMIGIDNFHSLDYFAKCQKPKPHLKRIRFDWWRPFYSCYTVVGNCKKLICTMSKLAIFTTLSKNIFNSRLVVLLQVPVKNWCILILRQKLRHPPTREAEGQRNVPFRVNYQLLLGVELNSNIENDWKESIASLSLHCLFVLWLKVYHLKPFFKHFT